MSRKLLIISLFTLLSVSTTAQKSAIQPLPKFSFIKGKRTADMTNRDTDEHSKLVASTPNVTLGLFGVHRLYLGTSPQIPVIYTLTLGGGGFIMLTDLGVILFTKDLEQYANNPHVIMWAESNEQQQKSPTEE